MKMKVIQIIGLVLFVVPSLGFAMLQETLPVRDFNEAPLIMMLKTDENEEREQKVASDAEQKILAEEFGDAVDQNDSEKAFKVLEKGFDFNARLAHIENRTPLLLAIERNRPDIVCLLLDAKANVNDVVDGLTPLFTAVSCAAIDMPIGSIENLIMRKADINGPSIKGITPLCEAVFKNAENITNFLLRYKADVNKANDEGVVPLMFAAEKNNNVIIETLLGWKADVNRKDKKGRTALLMAIKKQDLFKVRLLLNSKARITACNINGGRPLHAAAEYGNFPILQEIIIRTLIRKNGVDQKLLDGTTPLMLASQNGHLECVRLLLENNAKLNATNVNNSSPLMLAARQGSLNVVRYLLCMKAHPNEKDLPGRTALLYVVQACSDTHVALPIIQQLLFCNTDPRLPIVSSDKHNGKKAVDFAIEKPVDPEDTLGLKTKKEIIQLLKNAEPVKIKKLGLDSSGKEVHEWYLRPSAGEPEVQRRFAIALVYEQTGKNMMEALRNRECGIKNRPRVKYASYGTPAFGVQSEKDDRKYPDEACS